MTKQEQRHQIIMAMIQHNYDIKRVVANANNIMAEMYGKDWGRVPIVSIAEQNGEKGVRLCAGDVDIFIEAHDLNESQGATWGESMGCLNKVGKRTFNLHEMYLVIAYMNKINEKMREIGGDELKYHYWSSTGYGSTSAWYVSFESGYIRTISATPRIHLSVRPCAAFINN